MLRYYRGQVAVDRSRSQFPDPELAEGRDDLAIEAIAVLSQGRRGTVAGRHVSKPRLSEGDDSHVSLDLRPTVIAGAVPDGFSECSFGFRLRRTVALNLAYQV
jgi:hypothetical protein